MDTHIDWLSFTVTWGTGSLPPAGWQWEDVQRNVEASLGADIIKALTGDGWEASHGRAPYAFSFHSASRGVRVFWSGKVSHALIEVSGVGAAYFHQEGLITELLTVARERCTRIDIATDIETDLKPLDFASMRAPGRTKARGSYTSKSGETEYVGSRASERFARVYRYAYPHPRSHLLRVEHELKGDTAKAAVGAILAASIEHVQRDLGGRFGWLHPVWQADAQARSTFALPERHRANAKTELWLRTQVAAAFKKLVKDGTISDPEAWLNEVFLGGRGNLGIE